MADDALSEAWEKATKDITKGKNEGALQTLRAADPQALEPMTARLVGEATWNIAKANDSKSDYRRAAMFLREASAKNPKDKKTSSLYNKLLNEMQEKRISETVIPRMFNNGGPTLAGMVVMFGVFLVILAVLAGANSSGSSDQSNVVMEITWTDTNNVEHSGKIWIEFYDDDTPMHAESFRANAEAGRYDGTIFHRIVDGFMIQGGDFENGDGTGAHAGKFFGYCAPSFSQTDDCRNDMTNWVIPAEFGQTHEPGTIAAARSSNENSAGGQFYLVDSDGAYSLDGQYTAFGKAYRGEIDGSSTSGIEVIDAISQVQCQSADGKCSDQSQQNPTASPKSVHPVTLVSVELIDSEDPWYKFW